MRHEMWLDFRDGFSSIQIYARFTSVRFNYINSFGFVSLRINNTPTACQSYCVWWQNVSNFGKNYSRFGVTLPKPQPFCIGSYCYLQQSKLLVKSLWLMLEIVAFPTSQRSLQHELVTKMPLHVSVLSEFLRNMEYFWNAKRWYRMKRFFLFAPILLSKALLV